MTVRRHFHKADRTPEEATRLRADRDRYQREKPSVERLLTEGGHDATMPLGELLLLHEFMVRVKQERERQGLTLAQVAERSGIDQAALSRLENGKQANPTWDTLSRIARALGKEFAGKMRDVPANKAEDDSSLARA